MSDKPELTGRRRYRTAAQCYRNELESLVLQVEVSEYQTFTDGGIKQYAWKCYWRDATKDDVTAGELA